MSKASAARLLRPGSSVTLGALASWVAAGPALALDPATPLDSYEHESLTEREGLPSPSIRSIVHRSDGFVWLATAKGVVSFDGHRARPLHDAGRRAPLADAAIADMVEVAPGLLWLASDSGSGLLNVQGGDIRVLLPPQGLPHHYVRALLLDVGGALWVGTAAGLARLHRGRLEAFRQESGLPDLRIRALAQGLDGTLWVGTSRGLVKRAGTRFIAVGPTMTVQALVVDARYDVWVGTSDDGLHRIQTAGAGELRPVLGLPARRVLALLQDRRLNLWVGTDQGLFRRNGERFETFAPEHPLNGRPVRLLYEDREGTLWVAFGEGGGVVRLRDSVLRRMTRRQGLSSDVVNAVHGAAGGGVWVATAGGVDRVIGSQVERFDTKHGLSAGPFRSVVESADGRVWALDGSGQLFVKSGGAFQRHSGSERVFAVFLDGRGRALLASKTLHSADNPADVIETPKFPPSRLRAFHVGPSGRLWLATRAAVFRLEGQRLLLHDVVPVEVNGTAQAVREDRSGAVWVVMSEGGLIRLSPGRAPAQFRLFHGLPSERLFSALDDDRGSLWLGSADGVLRLARDRLEEDSDLRAGSVVATLYGDVKDGPAPASEIGSHPAAWRAPDGTLYFASARGLLALDPSRETARTLRPRIEQVLVNGVPAPINRPVRVPSSAHVSVTFVAPVTSRAERVLFRYRLNGHQPDWVRADATRTAALERLTPGAYELAIQVRDGAAGTWADDEARLAITVAPPLWRTPWLIGAALAAAALGALAVHRSRLRRTRERFEAVVEERNRIARDMHDSLAQAFVAISVQLDGLRLALKTDPQSAHVRLTAAVQAVDAGVADTRRAVRALRSSALRRTDLAPGLRALALALRGRCAIEVEVSGDLVPMPEDMEEDLLHIGQEAITNAVRHADARRVDVRLSFAPITGAARSFWRRRLQPLSRSRSSVAIRLEIADDGRGFDPRVVTGGHGLRGMRERATRLQARLHIESAPQAGTRVAVELTL